MAAGTNRQGVLGALAVGPRIVRLSRLLPLFLARVLPVDQDAVVDNQDEVGAAVAVDVAEDQVAGLDGVAAAAEGLALEDLEDEPALQVGLAGVGDELDEVLGHV